MKRLVTILFFLAGCLQAQYPGWENYVYGGVNVISDTKDYVWVGGETVLRIDKATKAVYNFTKANSGMESGPVVAFSIDTNDNIWVAKNHGVYKISGKSCTKYLYADSLRISCMVFDKENTLWVGTFNHGLFEYNGVSWITYDTTNSEIPSDTVISIAASEKNWKIFICRVQENSYFYNSKIITLSPDRAAWDFNQDYSGEISIKKVIFTPTPFDWGPFNLWSFITDENFFHLHRNGSWYGTGYGGGFCIKDLDYNMGTWLLTCSDIWKLESDTIRYVSSIDTNKYSNPTCIYSDRENNIWIGTYKGILNFTDGTFFETYKYGIDIESSCISICSDKRNNLYILQEAAVNNPNVGVGQNVYKFTSNDKTFNSIFNDTDSISAGWPFAFVDMKADKNLDLWLVSCQGIVTIDSNCKFKHYKFGDCHEEGSSCGEFVGIDSNNTKWFPNAGNSGGFGGLFKFDSGLVYNSFDNLNYYCKTPSYASIINIKNNNEVWLTDNESIFKYTTDSISACLATPGISTFIFDMNNRIIAGDCWNGFFIHDSVWTIFTKENSDLPSNGVYCLAVDKKNNIWIGTDNGLVKYDNNKFITFDTSNSALLSNLITSLIVDHNGVLWIGTALGGLCSFDETAKGISLLSDGIQSDYCQRDTLNILFDVDNTFDFGNEFLVQLSDKNGSFNSPLEIGKLNSSKSGPIKCSIPSNTEQGEHYRVRISGTQPRIISNVNSSDIKINGSSVLVENLSASAFCAGESISIHGNISCNNFTQTNKFQVELSDKDGKFDNPIILGNLTGSLIDSIDCQIPDTIAFGSKYRIRITASDPFVIGSDNGKDITIKDREISSSSISVQGICPGSSYRIPYEVICGKFNKGNIFTAQLSDENGLFSNPIEIGIKSAEISDSIDIIIPSNIKAGNNYRIRVNGSNPQVIGRDNGTDISIKEREISNTKIQSQEFCTGSTNNIPFDVFCGKFNTGNIFTAQLSDENGDFTKALDIGTKNSESSDTIVVLLPNNIKAGKKYRIRVNGSDPQVIGSDIGADISIKEREISSENLSIQGLCPSAIYKIPFEVFCGKFNTGNIFTVQLSDEKGDFAKAVDIGFKSAEISDTIEVKIPDNVIVSSKYRIRINGSNPLVTGSDNGKDIAINERDISSSRISVQGLCPGATKRLPFDVNCGKFKSGNKFTAQLSDENGNFTNAIDIGSKLTEISDSIDVTIPDNVKAGSKYRIRVNGSDPVVVGSDNGQDIVIAERVISAANISIQGVCPGSTIKIPFEVFCGKFNALNIFSAQLSDENGDFTNAMEIGSKSSQISDSIDIKIPENSIAGNRYRIRINGSNPPVVGSDDGKNIIINEPEISTKNILVQEICPGLTIKIPYEVSCGKFDQGNLFTAQLSDENGDFAKALNIGSKYAETSDSIILTIPNNIKPGNKYRIRVNGSYPTVNGSDNGKFILVNEPSKLSTMVANYSVDPSKQLNSEFSFSISYDLGTNISNNCRPDSIYLSIRFLKNLFHPINYNYRDSSEWRIIDLVKEIGKPSAGQVLVEIYGKVLLGDTLETPVIIENSRTTDNKAILTNTSGSIKLINTEVVNGKPVLLTFGNPIKMQIIPNPANDKVSLSIENIKFNSIIININNSLGQVQKSKIISTNSLKEIIEFDLNELYTGTYSITLISGTEISKKILLISK